MRKVTRRPTIFRHSVHAEWGHGIVVDENPGKLYLHFEHGGRRPIVNDARYRQFLVEVELPAAEAASLVASLEKRAGLLPRMTARKKAPAKARPAVA